MKLRTLGLLTLAAASITAVADKVVILTCNDVHSQIEPVHGMGGALQRKAVMDSVRSVEKNVLAVDAGDVVQGSLYFKYFRGALDYPMTEMYDFDVRVLGNHEFDNGMDDLAKYYKNLKGSALTVNYDFTGTPMDGIMQPYVIKEIDGKRIGFFGVNVNPAGLIVRSNYEGMKFLPIIETSNATAAKLKHDEGCDLVVAVTHIGYDNGADSEPGDVQLAAASHDIDIIIGGHSHTLVDPNNPQKTPYLIPNADGRNVLVTQTGKYGRNVGKITVDLNNLGKASDYGYELIPVTDRFPAEKLDKKMAALIEPYKQSVDSVNRHVIAWSSHTLPNDVSGGYANFSGDFAKWYGQLVLDSIGGIGDVKRVDLALMNVGGIRQPMEQGAVTEGQILATFPFSNRMVLVKIKGRDLLDVLNVCARRGGEAVSGNVHVVTAAPRGPVKRAIVDMKELEPDRDYVVATIDYVAQGNDYMTAMTNGEIIWEDSKEMCAPILRYVELFTELGMPIAPDENPRFTQEVVLP